MFIVRKQVGCCAPLLLHRQSEISPELQADVAARDPALLVRLHLFITYSFWHN